MSNDDVFSLLATVRYKTSGIRCSAHIQHNGRMTYVAAPTLGELLDKVNDILLYLHETDEAARVTTTERGDEQ